MSTFKLSTAVNADKVFLIQKSILNTRFDPEMVLYTQSTQKFIYPVGVFKNFLKSKPQYGAGESGVERYSTDMPRYIRITDINDKGCLSSGLGVTAQNIDAQYILNHHDLLIARSGNTVGKAYLHDADKTPELCIYAGYMIRFVVDKAQMLPEFVFLYTQLQPYKNWVKAIQRTAGQPNINAEEYKSLPIPCPTLAQQQDLVDSFYQASKMSQQKHQQAAALLASIDGYLLNELGITLPERDNRLEKRMFYVNSREVTGGRFDADFHKAFYVQSLNRLFAENKVKKLKDIVLSIFQGVGKDEVEFSEFQLLKVKNIKQHNCIDFLDTEYVANVPINKVLQKNDIVSPFIGEAIKQYKFASFDRSVGKYTVDNNTGVIRINPSLCNPIYVCELLNSILTRFQIDRYLGGGGVPFLGASGAKEIMIPAVSAEKQEEIVTHIQSIRTQAQTLQQHAEQILADAKAQIERMILGGD